MTTVEPIDEIASIERAWEELADRVRATPFTRPGWINAWWDAFGQGRLEMLVARRDRRITGLLALHRRRGALCSTTNWHSPGFAPLAEDDDSLQAMIDAALERTAVRLDLSFLPGDSTIVALCRARCLERGFATFTREVQRSPYLDLDVDWDAYHARLPKRRTSKYRRFRRRLEEQGTLTTELVDDRHALPDRLAEGFAVEAAGLRERKGTAISARPETERFYTRVAEWAAARGWLRLWFLRLDDRPLAFALGLEANGTYFDLKLGFDPAYARYGPGVLLMEERIRHAFASGLERFEFLGAAERHKLDWTDSVRSLKRLQAFAPTVRGRGNRLAWERARPLAKRLLRQA